MLTNLVSALLLSVILIGCKSAPDINNQEAVNKYLQSHTFKNSNSETKSFQQGEYQLYYDRIHTKGSQEVFILFGGDTYDNCNANKDWWYLDDKGDVCHQISDDLDYYFAN